MKSLQRYIALVATLLLPYFAVAQGQPTGLMTDFVTDASALYQNGYRTEAKMWELSDESFSDYQYAAIRSSRPTFGWIVPQGKGETYQSAYQIVVDDNYADAKAHRGGLWQSSWVKSSKSVAVSYSGEELKPNKTYYWSVRLKTNFGTSNWSEVEPFHTADY
ncbi:MAG: hypothetical protein IKZ11_04565, partial [Alistipes sp.]|nr:hypothetical protein [Alistipes sp.]